MKINLITITLFAIMFYSCSSNDSQETESSINDDKIVSVSVEQFNTMDMKIGSVKKIELSQDIVAQGVVEPSPNAKAYVTSPINALIKEIKVKPSEKVYKGQAIVVIDGPEVMNLQTEFIEIYNSFLLAKNSYERIEELAKSGIVSKKELLKAKGEYRTLEAKNKSYRLLLTRLGLQPDKILKGDFFGEAYLTSPIDGTVSRIESAIGKPITIEQPVAELIDTRNLLLKFYVFMNQVNAVKPGQKVEIELVGDGKKIEGEVISVGLDANTENKAVECFASLKQTPDVKLISGMRVTAKVYTNVSNAWVLPVTALHQNGDKYFVYILDYSDSTKYQFKKEFLQVGLIQDTIAQVFDSKLTDVLLKGGYELVGE
ncbi:efflux RND transporter periplasmic adaptor subunit [Tenuifilum thalassicum]|uniref:Efflux RND transporter periplasmic adaptor subunit n=1 Tax=Tenuifilum thalassicum TaxID=2590900 RepID=A0A7D4AXN9_9BACT|nr:efflux RND transporter periplasmic adaptor subunit [Tenuifilum thalassicum]QKG80274.1 efflux RND transporter periplasmic adaptor subunit [Tenuifilum thalassicum]